jgi:hypothetical protein
MVMRIYNTNTSVKTLTKEIIANSDIAKSAGKSAVANKPDVPTDDPVDIAVSEIAFSHARRGDKPATRLQTAEDALQLTKEVAQKIKSDPEQAAAAVWADAGKGGEGEGKSAEAERIEKAHSASYDLLRGVKIVNGMLLTMEDNIDAKNGASDVASVNAMIAAIRAEAAEMVKAQANIKPQDVLSLLEID